ncbi:MAG: methylmalonyl Co-A mutase-associated GTPase MeaB, partial [Rubrobacteraceae bacterium]
INKSDHPQAKGAASEVRSILEIGHELDPDAAMPPIIMTRGDTGDGVTELRDTIYEIRKYLEESGRLEKRQRASLREFVISYATDRLQKEIQHRLNKEDAETMDKVYSRALDPISASERVFREV